MARMSTDDSLGRDPRLDHLAELCGWTRRETAGCLQLDVWPLCYDRVTPNIPPGDIDRAANRSAVTPVLFAGGFSGALIESGFARQATRNDTVYHWVRDDGSVIDLDWRDPSWKGRVYLKGAADRIAYILKKQSSGRVGGKRSAESRGSKQAPLEAPLKHQAGKLNPSDLPSASPTVNTDPATAGAAPSGGLAEVKEKTRRHAADRAAKIPDRAWKAADYLREQVLAEDPAALVHREPWGSEVRSGWRLKWADEIRLMVTRDGRTYEQIADVLRWVFHEQSGDAKFIVQSADALREKFDRIQAVRRNHRPDKPQSRPASIPIAQGSLGGVK